MTLQNSEQSRDLLNSQAHIWNHIFSFINSMSIKCAIQLQIPDIINRHGAPMLLSELVEALPINKKRSHFVYRLMRILVHSGFFVKQSESASGGGNDEEVVRYLLAPASRFLLKEEPLSIRPLLLAVLDPMLMDPWHNMSTWFQNDDVTPFQTTHGKMFWELAGQEPNLNQFFNEAMASDARLVTSVVLEQSGDAFIGLNSMVDVGGGAGTVSEAIAKAFPKLNCICFDLPHVVSGLVGSKNMSYVGGDMFKAIPKANAVLLKSVLHDWNDEECIKNKEGSVDKSFETQIFSDMLMMTLVTGRERSEEDWAKLLLDVGFSDYKITPILGLRSLIQVYP